jgi:hypothetical protein
MVEWRVAEDMEVLLQEREYTGITHPAAKCVREEVIYRNGEISTTQIHVKNDLNLGFPTLLMSNNTQKG